MLFQFLKYVKPIWYFNLKSSSIDFQKIASRYLNENEIDENYSSIDYRLKDLIYRKLLIGENFENKGDIVPVNNSICLEDEYLFVGKYFSKFWLFYVFFVRFLTLKPILKELGYLVKALRIPKFNYPRAPQYDVPQAIHSRELVSVIIPTLNRYEYLKDVLCDLESQDYKNFEVIIVDQSIPFKSEFYKNWNLNIKVWHQSVPGLWRARNTAIEASKGSLILLYDDDSRVNTNWISSHLWTLRHFEADISSGISLSQIGARVPEDYKYFKLSDQIDTGNVLLKREIFDDIGLFDLNFEGQRMGDAEFGLRAYLHGYKNISSPIANRIHLKVEVGGLREKGSWDAWRPRRLFDARPIPSVLYYYRKYYGNKLTFFAILRYLPLSFTPYKSKDNKFWMAFSFIMFITLLPFPLMLLTRSWTKSTQLMQNDSF
ncbi:glycosyltransferase family 2 protein, partial [Schleiferiaceae bacterium]|nr:glycosyltransferase family 2 protein [Schleiferiaceae bacterium]